MAGLIELIARHASDQADRVALRDRTDELTYGELFRRARGLAARFRDAGVGPGDHVVMAVTKSVDSVAAVVATWLAGAVHVPIDPGQPQARQQAILERARPRLVIGDVPSAAAHRWSAEELKRSSPAVIDVRPARLAGDSIAYCMFTSNTIPVKSMSRNVLFPLNRLA